MIVFQPWNINIVFTQNLYQFVKLTFCSWFWCWNTEIWIFIKWFRTPLTNFFHFLLLRFQALFPPTLKQFMILTIKIHKLPIQNKTLTPIVFASHTSTCHLNNITCCHPGVPKLSHLAGVYPGWNLFISKIHVWSFDQHDPSAFIIWKINPTIHWRRYQDKKIFG